MRAPGAALRGGECSWRYGSGVTPEGALPASRRITNETSPDGDRLSTTHYEVDDSGEVIASSAAIIDLETGEITELPTTSLDFSFPWRPSA